MFAVVDSKLTASGVPAPSRRGWEMTHLSTLALTTAAAKRWGVNEAWKGIATFCKPFNLQDLDALKVRAGSSYNNYRYQCLYGCGKMFRK
jgi:hypothetical protein